jgi:hypothetical protein
MGLGCNFSVSQELLPSLVPCEHQAIFESLRACILLANRATALSSIGYMYDDELTPLMTRFKRGPNRAGEVNSKKPPHLWRKYLEPPVFSEIVKNHRFCVNLFQCALIFVFSRHNTISDMGDPLSG